MKKIDKPLNVPESLNSQTTQKRQNEIINKQKFPTKKTISDFSAKNIGTYTTRYKQKDIQKALKNLYAYKCAYCETKVEQNDVEHYRPKSIYYWLAYSRNNLLYCCPTCNQKKSNEFPVKNLRAKFIQEDDKQIHQLCSKYDETEEPIFINPEKENIFSEIVFNTKGEFDVSNIKNNRLTETIKQLDLNREYLVNNRKSIYDEFEKSILEKLYEIRNGNNEAKIRLKQIIETFKTQINSEYFSYRKYILINWIRDFVK